MHEIFLKTVNSTNTYAKENITSIKTPCLITADEQTAGRGRRGNSFFSPKNTGLYMTVVFSSPENCELLTPAAAVAVCHVLKNHGTQPQIKWVNDVFVNGRKVCGILTERFSCGQNSFIALGVGINLTTESFPENLPAAGSINLECDKAELAREIAQKILEYAENSDDESVVSEYRKFLFVLGKNITYSKNNVEYSAVVNDINEQCNLIVTRTDGTRDILSSGEISIKI